MVATDRISAFDVVLPTGIPDKGLVLNRISSFWFDKTSPHRPQPLDLPGRLTLKPPAICPAATALACPSPIPPEVAQQAMVVKRAERIDIECIVRGYITGSAWSEYRRQ